MPQAPVVPPHITPAELANRLGVSERRIRAMARQLGACHLFGNKMLLMQEDVDAIIEASKPPPRQTAYKPGNASVALVSGAGTYAELVKRREFDKERRRSKGQRSNRNTSEPQR